MGRKAKKINTDRRVKKPCSIILFYDAELKNELSF